MTTTAQCRVCQVARVRIKATIARWKWVRWPHTEPEGVGLPHRAPRRACAVIGNVFNAADSNKITGTQGVEIDLHIKTRADAPYKTAGGNYLKDDANGTPTFGELNLQGPDA